MKKKIIFFGTPAHSAEVLEYLYSEEQIDVVGVVTNPDRPVGRKKIMTPSPVKIFALEKNLPVFQPEKFTLDEVKKLKEFSADLFIIVAYGTLIPQNIIDIPKLGTFNLHFSLLPKYRGATPIQSALLAGEKFSGISIFELVYAMDAGDVFIQEKILLEENGYKKNHLEAWNEMLEMGKNGLLDLCTRFEDFSGIAQDEKEATFCGKFTKADGQVFPTLESAEEIMQKYRGYFIWPGIFSLDTSGKRILWKEIKKISEEEKNALENFPTLELAQFIVFQKRAFLQTFNGVLEIITLQKEGKKPCDATGIEGFIL